MSIDRQVAFTEHPYDLLWHLEFFLSEMRKEGRSHEAKILVLIAIIELDDGR